MKRILKVPKVLFLSRGSASRGQIAEGLLRLLAGDQVIPSSAGTDSAEVSPLAQEVMRELGVDISSQRPRELASLFRDNFHYVVALGDERRERYPVFPFARNVLRWSVPDPDIATGEPEEKKEAFRHIRDQMRSKVEELLETMSEVEATFAETQTKAA